MIARCCVDFVVYHTGPTYSSASAMSTASTLSPQAATGSKMKSQPSTFSPGIVGEDDCNQELGIWDRFPQTDYPQSPLPGKVREYNKTAFSMFTISFRSNGLPVHKDVSVRAAG
jgi:hypothetical protein